MTVRNSSYTESYSLHKDRANRNKGTDRYSTDSSRRMGTRKKLRGICLYEEILVGPLQTAEEKKHHAKIRDVLQIQSGQRHLYLAPRRSMGRKWQSRQAA